MTKTSHNSKKKPGNHHNQTAFFFPPKEGQFAKLKSKLSQNCADLEYLR